MPRGDGTGPNGIGQMTGRAAGYCAGNNQPGFVSSGFGNRMGTGRRLGHSFRSIFGHRLGRGYRNFQNLGNIDGKVTTKEQELEALKTQAENYEKELKDIKSRIEALAS